MRNRHIKLGVNFLAAVLPGATLGILWVKYVGNDPTPTAILVGKFLWFGALAGLVYISITDKEWIHFRRTWPLTYGAIVLVLLCFTVGII